MSTKTKDIYFCGLIIQQLETEVFLKQDYNKAFLAYKEKRFEDAISILTNLTARNHPPSKWLLGRMYMLGEGLNKDPIRAAELLTESGSGGFTFAQVQLD